MDEQSGSPGARVSRRSLLQGIAAAAALSKARAAELRPRLPNGQFNVIEIVVDTWSVHWLGCYGLNPTIQTPNVDALAARSVMFLDAYPDALPTVPTRRALYTGRQIFPSYMVRMREGGTSWRGWHPLYREDTTMAEAFRDASYRTQLISDVYHQFQPTMNFQFGFNGFTWIRGQERDRAVTGPSRDIDVSRYLHPSTPQFESMVRPYLVNRVAWTGEEDWCPYRVFAEAASWLDRNVDDNKPFYLHVESFAPHEMWDPPDDYYWMYMKGNYSGPRLIYPPMDTGKLSPLELEHIRALYAGLVTFTDKCVGMLLGKVEELGLTDNTMIVFVADHGTFMGEQGNLHKGEGQLRTQLLRIPLIIYHPDMPKSGRKIPGFVKHTDIMPTILDLNQLPKPPRVTGASLRPLMESGESSSRTMIYGGWNDHGFIRTPEWAYLGRWNPGVAYEEIYDLKADPLELKNLIQERPAQINECRDLLQAYVKAGWPVTNGNFLQADAQDF